MTMPIAPKPGYLNPPVISKWYTGAYMMTFYYSSVCTVYDILLVIRCYLWYVD